MSEIKVDVGNIRDFLPEIRRMAQGRALKAVNKPGVRTAINYELYEDFVDTLPVDTGAFRDSPISEGMESYERVRIRIRKTDGKLGSGSRYANGSINDDGIIFDPYEIHNDGAEHHYASYIRNLSLGARIRRSTARKRDAIAKVIIEEMNNGDNR